MRSTKSRIGVLVGGLGAALCWSAFGGTAQAQQGESGEVRNLLYRAESPAGDWSLQPAIDGSTATRLGSADVELISRQRFGVRRGFSAYRSPFRSSYYYPYTTRWSYYAPRTRWRGYYQPWYTGYTYTPYPYYSYYWYRPSTWYYTTNFYQPYTWSHYYGW